MSKPLKVALLGCGVVGTEVVRILTTQADHLAARVGAPLEFDRRNVSTTRRGELSAGTRERLEAWFAPEYDVWRRLAGTGEWSGARGTKLVKRPQQERAQERPQ